MPHGTPYSEEERAARHAKFYGGSPPPQRLGLGPKGESVAQKVWDALPALPGEMGLLTPPLPRSIARRVVNRGQRKTVDESQRPLPRRSMARKG